MFTRRLIIEHRRLKSKRLARYWNGINQRTKHRSIMRMDVLLVRNLRTLCWNNIKAIQKPIANLKNKKEKGLKTRKS